MSGVDPGSTGTILQNYRLIERAGTSVWRAEDTRTGKTVAVKILSKGLPKDQVKRDTLIREVRLGAALYHSFLVPIQEIVAAGDSLLLVMEWMEGQSITSRVRNRPMERTEFFRVAYQIADALKLLHGRSIVHGNIAGDSVFLLPTGQAKLAGLNLGNILPRQGQPSQYQQKGNDLKAVPYMAPEQIKGEAIGPQTDVFSLGAVLYEAGTGKLPYLAATAADVAHKIVNEPPASPKVANPNIDNAVLSVLGGCLFKDSFKRFKDAKAVLDAIMRVEPDAATFAIDIAKSAAAPAASASQAAPAKSAIMFVADVANYDELQASDPAAAAKSAARMQQLLGEAVYLFDGKVLDPFGPRMVAELGSVDAAVEAGRKGEFDFSQEQQQEEVIPVRMLLHAGEIEEGEGGGVSGSGVARAFDVLKHLPPLTLHVTEDFARRGKAQVRYRDAGARAGVKIATIAPPEPKVEQPTELETKAEEAAAAAEAEEAAREAAALEQKKRRRMLQIVAAVVAVVLLGGGTAMLMRSKEAPAASSAVKTATAPAPISASNPRKILVNVNGADAAVTDRAKAIRFAALAILRTFPEIRIADAPAPDVSAFNAEVRTGTAGPEIVVGASPPVAAPDAASGIQPVLQYVTSQLHVPMRGATPEAYNAFADAVSADASNDAAKTDAALRASTKADPAFLAAQLMAMKFFAAQKKPVDALEAAKHVLAAQSDNLDAARLVARTSLSTGDLAAAFGGYAAILRKAPNDVEALNAVGKYAVAVSDLQKLSAVLRRLAAAPATAEVHEPDALLAAGRIDAAVEKYYAVEEKVPNNAALSLKIGRIAVLRHSTPIAELELKKLQDVDPLYGMHLLKAYLSAQSGNKPDAASELKLAANGSTAGDDYWTAVAEVEAISGNTPGVLEALERASIRKEPTVTYILNNPLFSFLESDARFQKLKETLLAEQNEIRTALAGVSL